MPGRMVVGRFPNRAAALDYLVEKYTIDEKHLASYTLIDKETAQVVFRFTRDFGGGKSGIAGYIGNGIDLSSAIADLFKQLGESIEEETNA